MSRNSRRWTAAAVQMTSTEDRNKNLRTAGRLARQAAEQGADLVALPENFAYLRAEGSRIRFSEDLDGELGGWLADLARELSCYLLAGSVPEKIPRRKRIFNTSLLLSPAGERLAVYRKMHLFDIQLGGRVDFRESRTVAAGDRPVVVNTDLGRLGMSICYDLRFPEIYRQMVLRGAQVLLIPSAFTAYTGRHHWMPLLQARAIENLCWVIAPAQVGRHTETRRSHGHTAILDPWGAVRALRQKGEGVVTATIDLDRLDQVRQGLPALEHVRPELFRRPRQR